MKFELSRQIFEKKAHLPNFIKIRLVAAELFHADRRTDMTTRTVAFRNFANAHKKKYTVKCTYALQVTGILSDKYSFDRHYRLLYTCYHIGEFFDLSLHIFTLPILQSWLPTIASVPSS
jgi:hypothetical protein